MLSSILIDCSYHPQKIQLEWPETSPIASVDEVETVEPTLPDPMLTSFTKISAKVADLITSILYQTSDCGCQAVKISVFPNQNAKCGDACGVLRKYRSQIRIRRFHPTLLPNQHSNNQKPSLLIHRIHAAIVTSAVGLSTFETLST